MRSVPRSVHQTFITSTVLLALCGLARGQAGLEAARQQATLHRAAAAGEAARVDEGDKLRTPDSLAFSILGVSPTEIQKPTTPRALAVSLSKFVSERAMLEIPESLAIEVAPFWLWGHNRLEYEDYARSDAGQLLRNLSLSLGTTSADESGALRLATGVRSHFAFDRADAPRCEQYQAELQTLAGKVALGLSKEEMQRLQAEHTSNGALDTEALTTALAELKAEKVKAELKAFEATSKECAAAATARPRVLSFAAAQAWSFPASQAENGDLISQAYWTTYAHRLGAWTLLGLGRLRFDEADRGWDGFVDAGARVIYTRETFAAALEGVGRKQAFGDDASDAELQLRLALQVEYLVQDGTWLSVSFGKDFAAADAGSLFSLANLTTSFGDPKISR
jgi:hypothetical protein